MSLIMVVQHNLMRIPRYLYKYLQIKYISSTHTFMYDWKDTETHNISILVAFTV